MQITYSLPGTGVHRREDRRYSVKSRFCELLTQRAWTISSTLATIFVFALALIASNSYADEADKDATEATITCTYFSGGPITKTVDPSGRFVGDQCCGRYDAFDFAERLLDEEGTVVVGRIENVMELPETLLVRRDVQATVQLHKVFRYTAKVPAPKIQIRLSSDMFVWPETGESRINARQALVNEHERKVRLLLDRGRSLDEKLERGVLDDEAYLTEKSLLETEYKRLGSLTWEWDGEIGSRVKRSRMEPFLNCDNGGFTLDRGGVLEVGGTYLFALEEVTRDAGIEYLLKDTEKWNVFEGEEMDEIVYALITTRACLNLPELLYDSEAEDAFVVIDFCARWARGSTRPNEISRRR